jgi:hypothetical protein
MGTLDDKIAQLSKGDDAYAMKLKTHFREALGYSNYMSRLGQETAKPASIGNIEGLSPAGINARIGTRFGMQDDRINSLNRMSGAIDSAAGGLAADQISREKSAAAKAKENGTDISFDPKTQLEREIDKYTMNPKNPDGSTKSLQQFEAEMNEKFAAVQGADGQPVDANKPYDMGNGEVQAQDILDANKIKEAINTRIPKDYIGKEVYYQAVRGGAKDAEAQKLQTFDDYKTGKMEKTPGRKETYELLNPDVAKQAEVAREEDKLNEVRGSLQDDVSKFYGENKETIYGILNTPPDEQFKDSNGKKADGGALGLTSTKMFKNFVLKLKMAYPDLQATEVEHLAFDTIMNSK